MKSSLIDRYVKEVGRRLPRGARKDVEQELRSLLTDSLQARTAGKPILDPAERESGEAAVLKAFGPPEKTAARYAPPQRWLIGPNVFDLYSVVLFAVVISVTAVVLLLAGLSLLGREYAFGSFLAELGEFVLLYLQWLLSAFGSITLVFAVIGRLLPEEPSEAEKEEAWDPRTLPEAGDWTRIDARHLVFETVCIAAALLILNLFPGWIGLHFPATVGGGPAEWYSVPLLSAAFFTRWLPLWNVDLLLSILLNLIVLRLGRWRRATRIADFLLAVYGAVLLGAMLAGPELIEVGNTPSESLRALLQSVFSGLLRWGLAVSLIVVIFDAVGKMAVIILRRTPFPSLEKEFAQEDDWTR